MGATYSVAEGVFEDMDTTDKFGDGKVAPAYRVRRWVWNATRQRDGGLMLKFVQRCEKIAKFVSCASYNTGSRGKKRAWSATDFVSTSLPSVSTGLLPDDLTIGCFDIGPTVGTGSYATVCIASLKASHGAQKEPFALKVLHKTKVIEERQVLHVKNERDILSSVRHPFIVNYIGCFQDAVNLYMLLEYVSGGELFSYIYKYGALGYSVARFYTAQAVLAIDFLHSKGIVYRDLKPENMLLDMFGHIRLVDFGFAKHVTTKTYTVCGTHDYLAPEIFLRCGHGVEADWWSMGILVYELIMGSPPFHSSDPFVTYDLALENKLRFPLSVKFEVKDFIRRLLVVNPQKRLGSVNHTEIYSHKFFGSMDWVKMLSKKLKPPIVPIVNGRMDTANYMRYPDVWRVHDSKITIEQQNEFFRDFYMFIPFLRAVYV